MYRQEIRSLEDLAEYLQEGVVNRRRQLNELVDHPNGKTELTVQQRLARLEGEIFGFEKVLQILDSSFEVRRKM